jgi:hypothetical protein
MMKDGYSVELNDDAATFHLEGEPDARACSDGRVRIGDDNLELSDAQRAKVRGYVWQLEQMRDSAFKVGMSAAHFALTTMWDATVGMLLANRHDTQDRIKHRADRFKQKIATKIGIPIDQLRDSGEDLAADVQPLAPYLPDADTLSKCMSDAMDDDC